MEWNWDWAWWNAPKRVVKPDRQANGSKEPGNPVAVADHSAEGNADEPGDHRSAATQELIRTRRDQRSVFQLYLLSGEPKDEAERGEHHLVLQHAGARSCAMLLEMLCVPLGRSGNSNECYLLYEDRGEFDQAIRLTPMLDVTPIEKSPPGNGPQDAFRSGIGLMLAIMDHGAMVEKGLIEAAEKNLAEAVQSESLSAMERWAAGILASRLMCEYKYDYAASRVYAMQAERLANSDSLEKFTAMYWRADALTQEGKSADANTVFQEIIHIYGARVARSQLVHQSKSGTKGKKQK